MPGIAGIVSFASQEKAVHELDAMLKAMRHNERFSYGRWSDQNSGLHVAWTCHPRSFSDGMPLVSDDGATVLIFSGETFDEPKLVAKLEQQRPQQNRAKASYLIRLHEEVGDRFIEQLNGWFAGVLVERRQGRVTLFNDRYSMCRIYYHMGPDEFLFASEAKSLLAIRPALRSIEPCRLAEYLRYNCVLGEHTLFTGVSILPKASAWTFQGTTEPKRRQYFTFHEWEQQSEIAPQRFFVRWMETVSDVFPRYAKEGSDVALSSTAGLDTRLILATLRGQSRKHVSYTFGGAWGELFDVSTSRKIAGVYGQKHKVIPADERFLRGFADYARRAVYISDGTHEAFGAHDVFQNEIAREIAPIRLTGKFGSEIVRTRRLIPTISYRRELLLPEIARMVQRLPKYVETNPSKNDLTRVLGEEIPWHEYPRVSVEQSQLVLRTPYMDNELVKLMYRAPAQARAEANLQERYVRERAPEFAQFVTNLGRFKSRNPALTRMFYYFFWALFKVEYIYLCATPHWLTRLDRRLGFLHLERLLSGRQKWEGYRIWIETEFADFIRGTLFNTRAQFDRYFQRKAVEKMVNQHIAGTHNYLNEINKALTIELVCSTLLRE
jgi:asparagine synthase (glutamine-hydrolysing)